MSTPRAPRDVAAVDQFQAELLHRTRTYVRACCADVNEPEPTAELWAAIETGAMAGAIALRDLLRESGALE